MKRTGILAAVIALSSVAMIESSAHAAFRWPWQGRSKPAATATPARTPIAAKPTPAAPLGAEQEFVARIHDFNQREIALGNLALTRASDARVKQYAHMLIDDHTTADVMISNRARALGMGFQPTPNIAHDADYAALSTTKSAAGFDTAFLDAMVRGHDALLPDLASFKETESDHAFHAELVQLFDTMKRHRAEAHSLLDSMGQQRHEVKGTEPAPLTTPIERPHPVREKVPTTIIHK